MEINIDEVLVRQKRKKEVSLPIGLTKETRKLVVSAVNKSITDQIAFKAGDLIRAGLSVALGQVFVYKIISATKKSQLVIDPDEIRNAMDTMRFDDTNFAHIDGGYYFVTTKEPDHKAIEMLLNRAFGKPKETLDVKDERFSLRELGRQADELRATDAEFTEVKGYNIPLA